MEDYLWRGDLSECRTTPFGCEAVVNSVHAVYLMYHGGGLGAASQPNGDKSPRHR